MRCSICRRRFARSSGCPEHGQAAAVREPPAQPQVGGLALGALLGHGGFSSVWAGELEGHPVAVKIGHRGTAAARQRTAREAAALMRLAGAHAPALYRWDDAAARPYLVMARVAATLESQLETSEPRARDRRSAPAIRPGTGDPSGGGSDGGAADARASRPSMRTIGASGGASGGAPGATSGALGAAIAEAVAALHAAGVVHGDLKPENVAIGDESGAATLIDFGSASLDGAPVPLGASVEYMAPELWRGGGATAASDVYALGALIYEIAAGRPPFIGEARTVGHQHLMLRPPLAGFEPAAAALLARCLAKDPAQRPPARAVAEELRRLGPLTVRTPDARRAARPGEVRRCVVMVADVDAEAPAITRSVERHHGDLLLVRGRRVVVAWSRAQTDPVSGALALALELQRRHSARAILGIERIAYDERAQALRPSRANLEPAWLAQGQWRGVIGTAQIAALLQLDAPAGLVDLNAAASDPDAGGDAPPLVGRDRELAAVRACVASGRPCVIAGASGLGKSRLARQLASYLSTAYVSARELDPADLAAFEGDGLVVDDADAASDAVIDALAALSRTRSLVVVCAHDSVGRFRGRIPRSDVLELAPLDDGAAAHLLAQRLNVERIPDALLHRLVALGEGRPRRLVELAAHLHATGAVRRHDALDRAYLAPEAVTLPDHHLDDWLAEAALTALPAELREVAAACAVLEPGFEVGELEAALEAIIARVGGGPAADPETALVELAIRNLAVAERGGWRLTSPALARAARRSTTAPGVAAAAAAVLAYGERSWAGQLDERRRRALASYTAAAGDAPRAAWLRLGLAEDGRRAHRDVEAESDYTAALGQLAGEPRYVALLGRGIVRYRIDRAADALADLTEAAQLAGELGDRPRQARAQLEAATAHDWLGRYDDSARACEEAARLWPDARDPGFLRALAMARGRTAMRAGLYAEARPALEAAIEIEGADPGDDRLIAQLLLAPTLVQLGELDAAERSFEAALADAERLGDGLARCAALGNRVLLWSARRDHARARADLEATRALARRLGHAVPERNATLNLGEYLYWTGDLVEASLLAEASRELQLRLVGEALEDDVLLARVAAAHGDLAAARAALTRLAAIRRAWPLAMRCLRDAVTAFLEGATSQLDQIEAEARRILVGEELIEVLAWRFATHIRRGERDAARAALGRAHELGVGLQGWRFS